MYTLNDLSGLHDKYEFVAYAVKDLVADCYSLPSMWRSSSDAIRGFESSYVSQFVAQGGNYFTHPHDFILCAIGGYDSTTGVLESFEPFSVCSGSEIVSVFGFDAPWSEKREEEWLDNPLTVMKRYGRDISRYLEGDVIAYS